MKFKNINIEKILIIIVVLVSILLFVEYKREYSNNKVDNIILEGKIDKKQFNIYVQDGEDYIAQDSVPTGAYIINTELTYCVDLYDNAVEDVLTYENNKLILTSNKTVYCTVYFDLTPKDIKIVATNYNELHNTKTLNCSTNETNSPVTAYYNTKYQGVVFGNVKNSASNCTLTSNNNGTGTSLINTITGLITSGTSATSGNGVIVNESTDGVGYRYEGKKPNNYIWYNNEMWRIIGYVPVKKCTAGSGSACTAGSNTSLVKIIRNESIGGLEWHTSSENTWGTSYSLYKVLNDYYANTDANDRGTATLRNATTSGYCLGTVQADCDYTVKGVGANTYYYNMIEDVYWNTGKGLQTDTPKAIYDKEVVLPTPNVSGKIGLMNASDYGYASSEANHTSAGLSLYGSYATTNWLYGQGYEWTLTANSSNSRTALGVLGHGYVGSNIVSNISYAVRPVLYLKDSVYVVSGDGSEGNPYQVAIG